jgi:ubiquinone/menaquinone biosynthesis C-methylase UbiE
MPGSRRWSASRGRAATAGRPYSAGSFWASITRTFFGALIRQRVTRGCPSCRPFGSKVRVLYNLDWWVEVMDQYFINAQESYDRVSQEYAERIFNELEHKPLDREMLDRLAASVRPGSPLCDVGCGPGHVARYLHNRGAAVFGLDLSARMVELARSLNPGVQFVQGNMLQLDFDDESWGGIAALYSLIHIPREQVVNALIELRRVLQAGGLMLLSFHKGDGSLHMEEWWGKKVSLEFTFFGREEMERYVAAAGLDVEDIIERPPYTGFEYESHRVYIFARKPNAAHGPV